MSSSYRHVPLFCAIAVAAGVLTLVHTGGAPRAAATGRLTTASADAAMKAQVAGRAAATPAATPTAALHPAHQAGRTGGVTTARLSAAQLAGQRVIYSYHGLTPPASLLAKIRAGQAAGVIFFGGNISSPAQIRGVIKELQQANASSPVKLPLLMMTDQEGGLVRRLPGAPLLSEKQVGEASHPGATARAAGTGAGKNLLSVGVNVNLAPVLDVYRTPGNFIDQFQRSYSSSAAIVRWLGPAFIDNQQLTGVAATAKHFPGLGAATTAQNTDLGPVTLRVSLASLRSIDEAPYPAAISTGVRLIMVSWAVYPALDGHRPAGLSSAVVQRELRGRLGFKGVTITDALEAGALRSFGTTAHRGVLAAGAGMDLLLFSAQDVNEGIGGLNALVSALHTGQLNMAAFTASTQRVMALRAAVAP